MGPWWQETLNRWYLWISGADKVRAGIDHARTLVDEGNLDGAIVYLRKLERQYPSESTRGLIAGFEDPLWDGILTETNALIKSDNYKEIADRFKKNPAFYGELSTVVNYLNSHSTTSKTPK